MEGDGLFISQYHIRSKKRIVLQEDTSSVHSQLLKKIKLSRLLNNLSYSAVQLGMGYKPVERCRKSLLGLYMKAGVGPKDHLQEFRVSPDCVLPVGHKMSVRHFVPGQWVRNSLRE